MRRDAVGAVEKQNRRRCAITVLEGLRDDFTRVTVLAPICRKKSTKKGKPTANFGCRDESSFPFPAQDKRKVSNALSRGLGFNSHSLGPANVTKKITNNKTPNPSVETIIRLAQKKKFSDFFAS